MYSPRQAMSLLLLHSVVAGQVFRLDTVFHAGRALNITFMDIEQDLDHPSLLYASDRHSHVIRRINLTSGESTVLAGTEHAAGFRDGKGTDAQFDRPRGICQSPVTRDLFIVDSHNYVIRKVTMAGEVETIIGNHHHPGTKDGEGNVAELSNSSYDIICLSDGSFILSDPGTRSIRRATCSQSCTPPPGPAEPSKRDGNLLVWIGMALVCVAVATLATFLGSSLYFRATGFADAAAMAPPGSLALRHGYVTMPSSPLRPSVDAAEWQLPECGEPCYSHRGATDALRPLLPAAGPLGAPPARPPSNAAGTESADAASASAGGSSMQAGGGGGIAGWWARLRRDVFPVGSATTTGDAPTGSPPPDPTPSLAAPLAVSGASAAVPIQPGHMGSMQAALAAMAPLPPPPPPPLPCSPWAQLLRTSAATCPPPGLQAVPLPPPSGRLGGAARDTLQRRRLPDHADGAQRTSGGLSRLFGTRGGWRGGAALAPRRSALDDLCAAAGVDAALVRAAGRSGSGSAGSALASALVAYEVADAARRDSMDAANSGLHQAPEA